MSDMDRTIGEVEAFVRGYEYERYPHFIRMAAIKDTFHLQYDILERWIEESDALAKREPHFPTVPGRSGPSADHRRIE